MKILSHRGCWSHIDEQNTKISFERSFDLGFGIETDIRDYNGRLVISHEIPQRKCIAVKELLEIYCKYEKMLPLALNIKSDGLQIKLNQLLLEYGIENYFVFDTSIPDGMHYLKHNINYYTRQSEYEKSPSLYKHSAGVWLDEFKEHWINKENIQQHLESNKGICIVSPELHGRKYIKEWCDYKIIEHQLNIKNLMICTDHPEKAQEFFNEK
jgi:hypothetical protein